MRPPLEECEGAAGVCKAGGTAAVIDAPAGGLSELEFFARILEFNPSLLVLGVTFGSLDDDLDWATRLVAKFPAVKIAIRGAPCYVWGKEILARAPAIEFCVRGDYELVFEQVCVRGALAEGLTQRAPDGSIVESPPPLSPSLDALPFQDRSSIDASRYKVRGSRYPQATIHVQRGCPFPCTFCLVHTVSGNRACHRSPESVVAEVQGLLRQGIRHFYLRAETFSLDRSWAIAVSLALAQHCPEARWVTATRVECVDDEVIKAMRAGGCYGISFGVDVASEEIGRRVKKPTTCSPGTYSPFAGIGQCINCSPGTFSAEFGSLECTPCAVGRFAAAEGSASCSACRAGTYAPQTGARSCLSCPKGTVASVAGVRACKACPRGKRPNRLRTKCVK